MFQGEGVLGLGCFRVRRFKDIRKIKIGKQKIGLNHSFDFLSHYLYLVGAFCEFLAYAKIFSFRKCYF